MTTHEVLNNSGDRKKVKKVKTFQNFNLVYYQICTFFTPCFEVFLHFIINHKIDNQQVNIKISSQNRNFSEIFTFCIK
jgi:hypothetical protein